MLWKRHSARKIFKFTKPQHSISSYMLLVY
ncbi:UNVERIFIED_CONTAM: hypothetical protein GTU68_054428 [Idotea baltica]|nr:hypothetical protein [Idotea baltica]